MYLQKGKKHSGDTYDNKAGQCLTPTIRLSEGKLRCVNATQQGQTVQQLVKAGGDAEVRTPPQNTSSTKLLEKKRNTRNVIEVTKASEKKNKTEGIDDLLTACGAR